MSVDADKARHAEEMALAMINTLKAMSPKEREQVPSGHYAQRFDEILGVAKESAPDVAAYRWPKPVAMEDQYGMVRCSVRYVELLGYLEQLAYAVREARGASQF